MDELIDGKAIERAVMSDLSRPCLYGVRGPCQHPNCLESHYATLYAKAKRPLPDPQPDGQEG